MPYEIRKIKNGFKVCKKKDNKCFSIKPLTLEKAEKQLKILNISENLEGGSKPKNMDLYNKIKDEVYKKYKKHSLFRSALLVKLYKKLGGEYEEEKTKPKMNIDKWFKQKWISVPDYYFNKEIVSCGKSNTEDKFGVYPLCRPLSIVKNLNEDQMKKMIDKKDEIKEKHLITEKVLGTNDFNIKSTITGNGKEKNFINQLNKIDLNPNEYLETAKYVAKKRGYNPDLINFSNDGLHKLEYDNIKFGRVGYNDKIIFAWLEINNKVPKGTTKLKSKNYRLRAKKVMEQTNNKYSPASLAYNLIW